MPSLCVPLTTPVHWASTWLGPPNPKETRNQAPVHMGAAESQPSRKQPPDYHHHVSQAGLGQGHRRPEGRVGTGATQPQSSSQPGRQEPCGWGAPGTGVLGCPVPCT